ncbi:MAG: hypothetical protein KDD39_03880 [Bdellovibrionales bacterium]|nr:hypothetical protein [Bdellovibrionales bacterium]
MKYLDALINSQFSKIYFGTNIYSEINSSGTLVLHQLDQNGRILKSNSVQVTSRAEAVKNFSGYDNLDPKARTLRLEFYIGTSNARQYLESPYVFLSR